MELQKNSDRLNSHNRSLDKWLRFLIVVVLVLGIFFRFANLGKKVYWIDEGTHPCGYLDIQNLSLLSK